MVALEVSKLGMNSITAKPSARADGKSGDEKPSHSKN